MWMRRRRVIFLRRKSLTTPSDLAAVAPVVLTGFLWPAEGNSLSPSSLLECASRTTGLVRMRFFLRYVHPSGDLRVLPFLRHCVRTAGRKERKRGFVSCVGMDRLVSFSAEGLQWEEAIRVFYLDRWHSLASPFLFPYAPGGMLVSLSACVRFWCMYITSLVSTCREREMFFFSSYTGRGASLKPRGHDQSDVGALLAVYFFFLFHFVSLVLSGLVD